jgi:hypothetical protein
MTFLFTAGKEYLKKHGFVFENPKEEKVCKYQLGLPIYVLSPRQSKNKQEIMKNRFVQSGVNEIHFFDGFKFPAFADAELRYNILALNHIRMWEHFLSTEDAKGAFFFEDDIFLRRNWHKIVEQIFEKKKNVDILRFDSLPFVEVRDIDYEKNSVCSISDCFACLGGMYLSRDAITTLVSCFKLEHYNYLNIELFLQDITIKFMRQTSFEIYPKVCVQDWCINTDSCLQEPKHMKRLHHFMNSYYMKKFHRHYFISDESKQIFEETLKKFENISTNEIPEECAVDHDLDN